MNYIKHLTGFFDKVAKDRALNPTHISLYMSLFQFWNCSRFQNPISISRDEVMRISKISSKATYHKCLKALHLQGYIRYEPSHNPFRGSHVFLFNFSDDLKPFPKNSSSNFKPVVEQVAGKSGTISGTSAEPVVEQVVVPYINNTNKSNTKNNTKGLNGNPLTPEMELEIPGFKNNVAEKKEKKLREKKKSPETIIPEFDEVSAYFTTNNLPELEAHKFYNYNQSIGWLVGGKTPMVNWQAAAKNWILNIPKYQPPPKPDRHLALIASNEKDYAEPL